ncbi:MAG TPA: glycerophosphodiester phosphodiesterase [Gammaproteobacteria bacterium]|nr:glycerophosphodiester phosphodiesterase [Gammaproteobacteria bacterium]
MNSQVFNLSRIIAHRGASVLAPENTLSAFRTAYEIGAKWVEFDVMLAACGEVVVIHDETLDRTTNGSGKVCDYPYSYLKTLDAGSWFNPAFSGEKIPTLAEVAKLLREYNLIANIEIKPFLGKEDETVKNVLNVINECWQPSNHPPLISSFSRKVLECVRQYSSTHYLALLMDEWELDWERYCNELNCIAVDVNHRILNQARVAEVKSTGRFLLSYTVDLPERAENLFDWGVDAVFSNCPASMNVFLQPFTEFHKK